MRLGIIAETIVQRLALKTNTVAEPLVETQMAFSMARSIMAGVKLGLFEAASDGARSSEDIAKTCGTNPEATEKLLNALAGCRLLHVCQRGIRPDAKSEKVVVTPVPGKSIRQAAIRVL